MKNRYWILFLSLLWGCNQEEPFKLKSSWNASETERPWAGSEFWTNPLQAWEQKEGRIECITSGGDRNVVSLTTTLNDEPASFYTVVDIERLSQQNDGSGWVGFQVGKKGEFNDYRDDAVKGIGLSAGWTTDGMLFIGNKSNSSGLDKDQEISSLRLEGTPSEGSEYEVKITANRQDGSEVGAHTTMIHQSWLQGLFALTCSTSFPDTLDLSGPRPDISDLNELSKKVGGDTRFAFSNWRIGGDKVSLHEERGYGPILWTQHTISDNVFKMNVQMAPIGNGPKELELIIDDVPVYKEEINLTGYVCSFKLVNWQSNIDHTYAVEYVDENGEIHRYSGVIKKDPFKPVMKVVSLSCVDDIGFPHQDIVDNVSAHNPDLFIFHGDQLYERVGGYGVERNSELDYLRKWFIFGWTFGGLLKDHPSIIIPDDHDVYHGNLWGEGGKKADVSKGYGYDSQDSGGYKEPPSFVNMVHATQTGHLPDPVDNRPVQQGISVYFTSLNYGGVSFAILGDRQFKSAPKRLFPKAEIENGWPQNKNWNPKTEAFHSSTQLLGDRQEKFLNDWIGKWPQGIVFKSVVSQSPFTNVATLPADIYHDKYVPGLKRYKKDEYPPDDRPVADFDSNGWPKKNRDVAVDIMRKGAAIHLTGDQHLGSTGQYGIDEYGDAGYWVATPAVSNLWPRRWMPSSEAEGGKRSSDKRRYTGNYEDGFGNKMTIKAVANPYDVDREPSKLYDKAPGYSVIEFDRIQRRITIAVWPRQSAPGKAAPDYKAFEGWPIIINQIDNLGTGYKYQLENISVDGNTLVKVFRTKGFELIYSFKPKEGVFAPPVPDQDNYYIMTYSDTGGRRLISNLESVLK